MSAILRGFLQAANCDEFEIHHSYALGLQQEISGVLVAATPVDEHANIPIDGQAHSCDESRIHRSLRLEESRVKWHSFTKSSAEPFFFYATALHLCQIKRRPELL